MAGTPAVWGLDVGKCALKALKARVGTDGTLELLAVDYIEHDQLLSQPEADRELLIANALEKFLSRNDITNTPVFVSVPGQHTLARFSKLPPVEAKKVAEIVRYEAEQQIPFDMDEVVWDYQTFQEEDTPDIEVGIFAMKRDLIRDYLLHYENVGIEPAGVQSAPLALYNSAHFDGMLEGQTTVLLDIGTENTELIIASDYGLWTRTIPLGGNSFTDVLVKSFKLSFGKAESLKRTAASSKYARQVFQAMRPVFANLVQELQRSIGFYTSTHRDAELSKVVGMGNALLLPGLQRFLQQNLGMDVERPERFSKLVPAEGVDTAVLRKQVLSFGVAYGLALQGLGQSTIVTNLLPPEIARGVAWRKKRPYFGAAAACLLLAAGAIWTRQILDLRTLSQNKGAAVTVRSVEDARRIIEGGSSGATPGAQAREILAAANKLKQEYNQVAGSANDELDKIDELFDLEDQKVYWFKLVQVVHQALPKPQPELLRVSGPRDYRAVIEASGGALARAKREELFIEGFYSRFEPNLDAPEFAEKYEDIIEKAPVEGTEGQDRFGFLIKLSCRTPNENGVQLIRTFKENLLKYGRVPGQKFFVNRIWVTKGEELVPSAGGSDSSGGTQPRTTGRRGRRGRTGPSPGSGSSSGRPAEQLYDATTDEVMNHDWGFEIVFDVILEDLPESAIPTEGSATKG